MRNEGGVVMEGKVAAKKGLLPESSPSVLRWAAMVGGELVLLLCVFLIMLFQDGGLDVGYWFHNPVTEASVYGSMVVMLLITGLFPDFFRSFVYSLKKEEEITIVQLKRSLLSVKLAMVTAVVFDLFVMIFCFVSMMRNMSFPGVADAVWPMGLSLYAGYAIHGILPVIFLLPVYARVKVRLISM